MKGNIILANVSLNKWCNTEGINYYEGIEALGYLFKYAVPMLGDKWALRIIKYVDSPLFHVELTYCTLKHGEIKLGHSNPALALFRAIWEVIHEK